MGELFGKSALREAADRVNEDLSSLQGGQAIADRLGVDAEELWRIAVHTFEHQLAEAHENAPTPRTAMRAAAADVFACGIAIGKELAHG